MFTTNLGSYPRIIRYAYKSYNKRYDFSLPNPAHNACFCTFKTKLKTQEKPIYTITDNVTYNSRLQVQFTNLLKYSTNPIEVPPLPPPPPEIEFGTLGGRKYETVELDNDELKEEERLKNIGVQVPRKFKPSPGQYAQMIKSYIGKGDLESAERVIEECKRNRDKPTDYMYTLLIRAFAIQGDIKTCYKYFSYMKSYHFKIKANTYTSLYNACANSPNSTKALDYLERVRMFMEKQNLQMNHAHYNVLVKAYGRHNKLDVANALVQKMMDKKLKIGISTINSLLYAANTNKDAGLKHILQYWQLMKKLKIPPDIFTYNLLLRGIRETNFGGCTMKELFLTEEDIPRIVHDQNRPDLLVYPPIISDLSLKSIQNNDKQSIQASLQPSKTETSTLTSSDTRDSTAIESMQKNSNGLPASISNLNLDSILKQNKLILFGGVEGFLQKMKDDRIAPNVKTLTYLIDLVPDSLAAENLIIKYAKSEKIPVDLDFYNMLIKKRALRGAKKDARIVLDEIHKANLRPNIVTYGVLALSCRTANESRDLMNAMKATGHTINKFVAGSLLDAAFLNRDFGFILELMEKIKYERIRLDEESFDKLDNFQQKMTELIKTKHPASKSDRFKVGFSKFNMRYPSWQEEMGRKIIAERKSKQT